MRIFQSALALVFLASGLAQAAPETYKLDGAKSELVVQLFKEGIGASLAHDHVVRSSKTTGTVVFDPEHAENSSIEVTVDCSGLKLDEEKYRKKYGVTSSPSESDRKTIAETMRSAEQLDTAKYPTMSFKSISIKPKGKGKYAVTGNLTIHGKTNKVSFIAKGGVEDGVFSASGTIDFKQSSFGYQPYSALFGAIKVKDDAILNVHIVATK